MTITKSFPIQKGSKLEVAHDSVTFYGAVILEKGEIVTVDEVVYTKGYWSRLCPDIYVPPKIDYIKLLEHTGHWFITTFVFNSPHANIN